MKSYSVRMEIQQKKKFRARYYNKNVKLEDS